MYIPNDLVKDANPNFAISLYFLFKLSLAFLSGMAIYLGYKLFILGVTGQASLIVSTDDINSQLINAAPGLFFAIGGIIALIVIAIKGINIRST